MVMEPGEEGEDDDMADALAALAGGEGGLPPGVIQIELTEEDEAAIGRLEALGFPRDACIEAYLRCGAVVVGRGWAWPAVGGFRSCSST
jgi:hypothetical protein